MFDVKRATEDCVQWIREWFDKNSNYGRAIVGISGGVDSSVVAAILGIDTIAMPYKIGCCRGGADWPRVYMILESIFKNIDVELWKLGGDKIV